MTDRQWAEHIALRKSGATEGPSEQHMATPHQVYDLEVDSSLRGLNLISNDTSFVNEVMEKVAESNSAPSPSDQVRKSRPTVAPAFECNSGQVGPVEQEPVDSAPVDSAPVDFEQADPAVPVDHDVSSVPEKCLASTVTENANQTFEPETVHRSAFRRNRGRKPLRLKTHRQPESLRSGLGTPTT